MSTRRIPTVQALEEIRSTDAFEVLAELVDILAGAAGSNPARLRWAISDPDPGAIASALDSLQGTDISDCQGVHAALSELIHAAWRLRRDHRLYEERNRRNPARRVD